MRRVTSNYLLSGLKIRTLFRHKTGTAGSYNVLLPLKLSSHNTYMSLIERFIYVFVYINNLSETRDILISKPLKAKYIKLYLL